MEIKINELSDYEVDQILKQHESHFLDLKSVQISPASLTKTVSAFANTSGGEIYVGIDEVQGVQGRERIWRGFDSHEDANSLLQAIENMSPLGNHYEATFLSSPSKDNLVLLLTIFKSTEILYSSN